MTVFRPAETFPEVIIVEPKIFHDSRGHFSETYRKQSYSDGGVDCDFVQDNQSVSRGKGVLRGLHFQAPPRAQAKLVRCVRGRILDVAIDIRHGSPTFGEHFSVELTEANGWQLYVPAGFAHGFCTLEDECEVSYKVSHYYAPECEGGIIFDDPDLSINWPFGVDELTLSDKDNLLPRLSNLGPIFEYSRS